MSKLKDVKYVIITARGSQFYAYDEESLKLHLDFQRTIPDTYYVFEFKSKHKARKK